MTKQPHLGRLACIAAFAAIVTIPTAVAHAQDSLKVFISVDMEGIGGIGTGRMTSSSGKDYALGRRCDFRARSGGRPSQRLTWRYAEPTAHTTRPKGAVYPGQLEATRNGTGTGRLF